jgi:hypothetical protein
MVTPGTPPIPHVGMNCVGPGVPTVLIGKMPASTVGDTFLCVGPPAPVVTGAFNVLIGTGGGGGGGGGGGSAAQASAAQGLQAGTLQPIQGTETFPIDVQATLLTAASYMTPQEIQLQIKVIADALAESNASNQQETPELTIADIVEILEAVEREEGYEAARFFSSYLDYGRLTEMAKGFISGEDTNSENDPNQMPTRFMLLYGADDNKLQQIDDHPDRADGEEHKINMANLRKALRALGYDVAETGPYDEEVFRAHTAYLSSALSGNPETDAEYTSASDDDLGSIAHRFGLPSWKYLYEKNKQAIGDNPDLLKPGTLLEVPQWDSTSGDEKIEAKGVRASDYIGGLSYRYPWAPFSYTMMTKKDEPYVERDSAGNTRSSFQTKKKFELRAAASQTILASGELGKADEIELLVPDCRDGALFIDNIEYEL